MSYDVAIVGAGPAGLAFVRSLEGSGLRVASIDQLSKATLEHPPVDGRDIALTHLSVKIMQSLGAWDLIDPESVSPIHQAKVLDGQSPKTLNFDTGGQNLEALGYLVSNHLLRKALYEVVEPMECVDFHTDSLVRSVSLGDDGAEIELDDGEKIESRLVIAADNRFSLTRRQVGIGADMLDFGREAIVCWMEHEQSHDNTAFECFHYGRTLAVLPMPGNVSSIVVTARADEAEHLAHLSPEAYARDIEQRFEHRLGSMQMIGERHRYPLVGVHARQFVKRRFALVGDAAVGMHPVTAHGFNLGLSGQDILAQQVRKAAEQGRDIGGMDVLKAYERKHMMVTRPLFHGTNSIVGLFTNDSAPAKLIRKAVLNVSDKLPPVKWFIREKLTTEKHGLGFPLPLF
ncbi:MAG: 5-demethoxyubiquinol-8 5-hydroxylase UbiM [Gammaproteobacteria bacterium]